LFYEHSKYRIAILDITTEEPEQGVWGEELGRLKYFLGIEISRSPKGIVLSQRKYDLDLLSDTSMLGYRAASTPIDQNHKLCAHAGDVVDRESYQKLVGRLLYLCHTGMILEVSTWGCYRILQYLKDIPVKGNGHLNVDGYSDADWASCLDDRRSISGFFFFLWKPCIMVK
jgi:hypothetical protein